MKLIVSDSACNRVSELIALAKEKKIALRVSVDGGGCSGFMYNYELVSEINEDDFIVQKNNTQVIVDPLSQEFLDGCEIDFVRELGASYFQIKNPNATSKCGCGNSFSV